MARLEDLDRRLTRAAERLEQSIETLVEEVGSEVGRVLVPATPVDTGRARANWRPSLNAPASRPVTLTDPTGAATIARIGNVSRSWRLGDTLYIVNRVAYIRRLNAGSSPQAPAGFVEDAVSTALRDGLRNFERRGIE